MKCKGCGKCCSVVHPFLELDIFPDYEPQFKKELAFGVIERANGSWTVKRRGKDKTCIFLNTENKLCMIYDRRPIECKRFEQGHPVCKIICKENK